MNNFDKIINNSEVFQGAPSKLDDSLKEQRWLEKRVGKLGSSSLPAFCASGRGKDEIFGKQAINEILKVKFELRTGKSAETLKDFWQVKHGKEHEPRALELTKEKYPGIVGGSDGDEIIYRTHGNLLGDSPDFEGDGITGEIKCPVDAVKIESQTGNVNFIETLKNGKRKYSEYFWQMAGHLLSNESAKKCVYVVYDWASDKIFTNELLRNDIQDELKWLEHRLSIAEIALAKSRAHNWDNLFITGINNFIKTIENE